jgi:2'-5' RNA ligase
MFVAIDISKDVMEKCREIISSLAGCGADLKIVKPENLHMTLKFLGEVREGDLDSVCETVYRVSGKFGSFRLVLSGLGYFGRGGSPRVIWAGLSEGSDIVSGICAALEKGLSHIRKDGRESSPHLTLARVRSPKGSESIAGTLGQLGDVKLGELEVKEIKLKQSVLKPDGPVYSDFKVFKLGQKHI